MWVSFGRGSPPAVLFEHEAVRLFDFDGRRLTTWNDVTAPTRALADALRSPTKKGAYREEGAAPVLSLSRVILGAVNPPHTFLLANLRANYFSTCW